MDVEDYTKILKDMDSSKLVRRLDFINKYLIPNIQYNTLKKICLFYKPLRLKYGQYVFKEGQKLENIYMVVSGEISVSKFLKKLPSLMKVIKSIWEKFWYC